MSKSARELRALLIGGDRRSIAGSNAAVRLVLAEPERATELVALAGDPDPLVSMRALDALEKVARAEPGIVQPHRAVFLGPLADSERWELRLQIVRTLPLLGWAPGELPRVLSILRRDVTHPRIFVRAWALDALATYSTTDARLRTTVLQLLDQFEGSPTKALQARARQIRRRIAGSGV